MGGLRIALIVLVLAALGVAGWFLASGQSLPFGETREGQTADGSATSATGEAISGSAPGTGTGQVPRLLNWNELLPEGEVERLQDIYTKYYEDMERQMSRANDSSLSAGADPFAMIAEGSAADTMPQLGTFNVVESLNGETIRIPGYIVPLAAEIGDQYTEFLLVPYFGACLHTPPPPPNQVLYVRADPAVTVEELWQPFWIEGVLTTEANENDLGNAAYTVTLSKIELYGI